MTIMERSDGPHKERMINRNIDYRSHGVPLETYELTGKDHRDQRTADDIHAHVKKQAAQWQAAEAEDPKLREARSKSVRRAWEIINSSPTPDYQIMRWRVRLYCGHVVETTRHCEVVRPKAHGSSSMRCPDCGMGPAEIVAYEPLGMLAKSSTATTTQRQLKGRTRQSVEKRLAKIEAEAMDLREQLKHLDD